MNISIDPIVDIQLIEAVWWGEHGDENPNATLEEKINFLKQTIQNLVMEKITGALRAKSIRDAVNTITVPNVIMEIKFNE